MPVPETPFTRAKKIGTARQIFGTVMTILRHGTPNFRRVIRIGPKCNVAPVLKILRVPGLPPGGSLGTGKRGQARNQDFMWGGANEAKVDQTTEMYFLLSDPFI